MKKMTKKIVAASLAVMMITGSFAACSSTDGKGEEKSDTLKIGATGPLTGGAASYGNSVKKGAQVAIDEINAAGGVNGIKLELLFQDDEADSAKAVSAFEKLMDGGMQIYMGAVTSGASVAQNGIVAKEGMLQITPSASQLEATLNKNSFRICFTDPMQGELMAEYAKTTRGLSKAAVIYNRDDSYSAGIAEAFKAKFTEIGGQISVDTTFGKDDKDFGAQLTKIKASDADFLFMPIYNDKAAQIAIAAKEKAVTIPMLGCDGWDGILEKYLKNPEDAELINGAVYLTPFTASDEAANVQAFVKAYGTANNGEIPDQFAADAYDAIHTIKLALEKADIAKTVLTDQDNAALVKAMTEITVDGITGKMTFTPEGEPNKTAKVARIVDGKYVVEKG